MCYDWSTIWALAIGWRDHSQTMDYDHGRRDHRHFLIKNYYWRNAQN